MRNLAWRFAWRELRSGVAGFRIFLACLALGVTAIAAAGSTAEAFRQGLASQAREILGGDLAFSIDQRRFTPEERAAFDAIGPTVYALRGNVMAQTQAGVRRLVDLRGVGPGYPLAGAVELQGAPSLEEALRSVDGIAGAAVEQALLDRLGLKLGERFLVGRTELVARAVLIAEPDRLGRGFGLGPRVLTTVAAVEAAGAVDPGGLFGETVRIAAEDADTKAVIARIQSQFPDAAFEARDRSEAASGAGRLIDQLEFFLGFIGLASLVAGGLGVYGAVSAFLEGRKPSIAILKALGAPGALVRDLYLVQIGALALLGVAIGLALGAAAPLVLGALAADQLPVPALFAIYPEPLLRAGAFGALAAAAFALAPLARVRATPSAALFRRELTGEVRFGPEIVGAVVAALGLAALAVLTAPTPLAALAMIAGTAFAFAVLWALGRAAAAAAGRMRARARGAVRLGLANLGGPRSAARTAAPAIGLGVALLSAVALIQSSLLAQIGTVAPRSAPSIVFTEIPPERAAAFDAAADDALNDPGPDRFLRTPLLTGRIVGLDGAPVDLERIAEGERWAFDEDILLTAAAGAPPVADLAAGAWWDESYEGPPLVVIERDLARGAGLEIGDTITLLVLGREIEARVAGLRRIDWGGFGLNFAIVLNAASVEGANPRSIAIARASPGEETALLSQVDRDFREVNVIRVREQLEQAARLFDRLALAVQGASSVAALAGFLVLVGAIAARARERAREAALLKVLGAARGQVLLAYLVEYGLVCLIAGAAGVALGALAAWPIVVNVFEATWRVDWLGALGLVAIASALGVAGGLVAALHALARRPAPVLREAA